MDGQLEICGGREIFIQGIRYNPNCCAPCIAHNLCSDALGSTLWPFDTSSDIHSNPASSTQSPAIDIPQCLTVLHYDIHSNLRGYRHAMRTISSLPILCLYRLVNTISVVESWLASSLDICGLGCSRVGLECVSEYQYQLDRGSRMPNRSGLFRMVGHEERDC